MISRILVATDGSPAAKAAADHAIGLAALHDAHLDVLAVAETGYPPAGPEFPTEAYQGMVDEREEAARALVPEVVQQAKARGIEATGHVERDRSAIEAILRRARQREAGLIVLGSHGRSGLERFLLGSVAEGVLREATAPVLVVRHQEDAEVHEARLPPYGRILVPIDGSPGWQRTLDAAIELAQVHEAELQLLYVVDGGLPMAAEAGQVRWGELLDSVRGYGRSLLEEASRIVEQAGLEATTDMTEAGRVHKAILNKAEATGTDLILLATHGRTGLSRFLLGSVTERVLRTGDRPVLSLHLEG